MKTLIALALMTLCGVGRVHAEIKAFSKIPSEQRLSLSKRLDAYVHAQQSRDWEKLYDFVSDIGRGGVSRQVFIKAMQQGHGRTFANEPDLLEFRPKLAEANDHAYDVYGCAKAEREGENYDGVAVIHAVREHDDWLFTGWTFTVPNEPCKALSDSSWQPMSRIVWKLPMEELRNLSEDTKNH